MSRSLVIRVGITVAALAVAVLLFEDYALLAFALGILVGLGAGTGLNRMGFSSRYLVVFAISVLVVGVASVLLVPLGPPWGYAPQFFTGAGFFAFLHFLLIRYVGENRGLE